MRCAWLAWLAWLASACSSPPHQGADAAIADGPPGPDADADAGAPLAVSDELAADCPALSVPYPFQGVSGPAWNGTQYAFTWQSARYVEPGFFIGGVTPDGQLLYPYGLEVDTPPIPMGGLIYATAMAPDGEMLVAIREWPTGIRVLRIAADGTAINPGGAVVIGGDVLDPIISPLTGSAPFGMAFGGGVWLLVWQQSGSGDDELRAARLTRNLQVLDPGGVLLGTWYSGPYGVAAASDGSDFVVSWSEYPIDYSNSHIKGALLKQASFPSPQAITIAASAADEQLQELVGGPDGYVAMWLDVSLSGGNPIRAARISSSGVVDAPVTLIDAGSSPRLSRSGDRYLLTYADGGVIQGRVLDANLAAQAALALGAGETSMSAGDGSSGFLAVWNAGDRLLASRVAADGTVLDPGGFALVRSADTEWEPDLAMLAGGPLLVWRERDLAAVAAGRLDGDGAILDGTGIPLAAAAGDFRPAVAATGAGALVVWEQAGIRATRVGADGIAVDQPAIAVSADRGPPAVACGPDQCLVVWGALQGDAEPVDLRDVRAARVSLADGAVLDPAGLELGADVMWAAPPDVAATGSGYLVTWEQRVATAPGIRAARVDTAGTILDPGGVPVFGGLSDFRLDPRISCAGDACAVAWRADRETRATRVDPATAEPIGAAVALGWGVNVEEPFESYGPEPPRLHHDVIAHAGGFLVVWEVYAPEGPFYGTDLVAARVAIDGTPEDAAPFLVAADAREPALAVSETGRILLAYSRFLRDPPFAARRVRARFIGESLPAPADACAP